MVFHRTELLEIDNLKRTLSTKWAGQGGDKPLG